MIDINYIKQNKDKFKQHVIDRGIDPEKANVDKLLALNDQCKSYLQELEQLNAEHNKQAEEIANLKGEEKTKAIHKATERKQQIKDLEKKLRTQNLQFKTIHAWMPNKINPDMPIGKGEEDNIVFKAWRPDTGYLNLSKNLTAKDFDKSQMPDKPIHAKDQNFVPTDHLTLGEKLNIIDIKQSAKVSGSRFYYLKKQGVLLQWAMHELLKKELLKRSFIPMAPPLLIKERALFGTSHIPSDADQIYEIAKEYVEDQNQLYLVGSSEPSNFAYFTDKLLDEKNLPQKIMAITPCFRTEVGSWGKDVRGIKRAHQFTKLEMDVVCTSAQSEKVYNELLEINEWFWQALKIPYRIVHKCTGDAGYLASYQQADIEGWLPSQKEFIELGTNTNALDFQARRLNIKVKTESPGSARLNDKKKEYAHTVNDTGVSDRSLIAILDNYQQADQGLVVPEVLRDYVGNDCIL